MENVTKGQEVYVLLRDWAGKLSPHKTTVMSVNEETGVICAKMAGIQLFRKTFATEAEALAAIPNAPKMSCWPGW